MAAVKKLPWRRPLPKSAKLHKKSVKQQEPKLSLKQQLFVEAYIGVAKGNGTEAARLAGYAGSEETLAAVAAENLRKPQILSRVRARVDEAAMSADEVLAELTKVARAEWKEFLEIKHGKRGEAIDAVLLLKDKLKALELLGKYHKLFTEKHEHSGPDGGAPVLNIICNNEPGTPPTPKRGVPQPGDRDTVRRRSGRR